MRHSPDYVENLTALRGLAALWIVVFHYNEFLRVMGLPVLSGDAYTHLLSHAYVWVDFFFILSGFIITHVYANSFCKAEKAEVLSYLWGRFSRLYPLLLFSMLLMLAYIVLLRIFDPVYASNLDDFFKVRDFFAYLGFAVSFGFTDNYSWNVAAWSISAEWWAYIAAILLIPSLHKRSPAVLITIFVVLLLCVSLLGFYGHIYGWDGALDTGLVRCILEFVMGVIVYQAYLKARDLDSILFTDLSFLIAAIGNLVTIHLGGIPFVLLPCFALLILSAALNRGRATRILNWKPFHFIGEISYSVYLLHLFWLYLWSTWFDLYWRVQNPQNTPNYFDLLFWLAIVLICVIGSSVISHRYIEVAGRKKLRSLFSFS